MYQDCLSSTKWLRMFKPSMLYRTSKMSKLSRPTIFPEDQLVPLCCGSTTTDHRLMGGHWEATGRPLGDRRRRGTGFIMGKVTLTGATILPVCPTCMSFGTYPASTAALDAPTGNTIHNITIHTYTTIHNPIHTTTTQYHSISKHTIWAPTTQYEP